MRLVSKENPLPLYYQLKEILQEMIENEEIKPGSPIPSERELCEIQNISRMTVNKAIISLVNEGILFREQGKGTFVSIPKEKHQLTEFKGFTEEMKEKGITTETKILSFTIKKATKQIQNILCMNEKDDEVIEINRLRKIEGIPISIEKVYIPYSLCRDMTKETVEGKSLYNIFKTRYRYYPNKAKQTVEPIMLNEYECELLQQKENSLALIFKRITYMESNIPIEYTKAIYRTDNYKYEITLGGIRGDKNESYH